MVERTNWNVAKCTESFDSCEEALSYMSSHSFDGMILEREDDTFMLPNLSRWFLS